MLCEEAKMLRLGLYKKVAKAVDIVNTVKEDTRCPAGQRTLKCPKEKGQQNVLNKG